MKILQNIKKNLNGIPEELKDQFQSKIDTLVKEVQEEYDSPSSSSLDGEQGRKRIDKQLEKFKEIEKDMNCLQRLQEALKEYKQALNSICQDNDAKSLASEIADRRVYLAMKKYGEALSRGERDQGCARSNVEKTSTSLETASNELKNVGEERIVFQIKEALFEKVSRRKGSMSNYLEVFSGIDKYKNKMENLKQSSENLKNYKDYVGFFSYLKNYFGYLQEKNTEDIKKTKEELVDFLKQRWKTLQSR